MSTAYKNPRYEHALAEAKRFSAEAINSNFTFDETLEMLREAWIIVHQDKLSHAQWQVEQDLKRKFAP